jgi:hypothetical protein
LKDVLRVNVIVKIESANGPNPDLVTRFELRRGKDWREAANLYDNLLHCMEGNALFHSDTDHGIFLLRYYKSNHLVKGAAHNIAPKADRAVRCALWRPVHRGEASAYEELVAEYLKAKSVPYPDPRATQAEKDRFESANSRAVDFGNKISNYNVEAIFTEFRRPVQECSDGGKGMTRTWFWYSDLVQGTATGEPHGAAIMAQWEIMWQFSRGDRGPLGSATIAMKSAGIMDPKFSFDSGEDQLGSTPTTSPSGP